VQGQANGRRIALITDTNLHLGPDLARTLAVRGHDLIIGEPEDGLAAELREIGAKVETVDGVADLADPASMKALRDRALEVFGRIDAACIRTGRIITGDILGATVEDLHELSRQNIDSVFHALQTLIPPMQEAGAGQIVIVTSATGAKPSSNAALYSATRAAANMLVKNAALSVADSGVTINAIGTNFLDFPGFRKASGADDPEVRARIEKTVPMRRLGTTDEVAHFCASLLDGRNRFQTGQFFSLSGGWSD
jgi:NAD(P)-dependent dehydrogenase (short-subunit alcohol dehydrogenase family)